MTDEFEFTGKILILCNTFPTTAHARAVKSRALTYAFQVTESQVKELLFAAAADTRWYKNTKLAKKVATFLCGLVNSRTLPQISYRTLEMGYELAEFNPDHWQELLRQTVADEGEKKDPHKLIKQLSKERISVREQLNRFERETGFKRRTFFKYRRELNISER